MLDIRQPHWLAAYTKPRNEKKVYRRLVDAGIETFLPLQKRMKQWSDRKKLVEEPLLRSYIFVRITEKDYFRVLGTPGVVRYVSFEGKAAPIPDRQIDTLKMLIGEQVNIEVLEHDISPGEKVVIELGTMRGFEGELVRIAGENRVVIRIEHVTHSLLVTLPSHYIVKKR
ncbi:MAG TPA: UpxY family transcription antiterminator [Tenuifilaceae bacterium]|nr:UpxY family transcription antiterminator [Tenuifilaceae bacterium]